MARLAWCGLLGTRIGFGWEAGCAVLLVDVLLFVAAAALVLGPMGRRLRPGPWRAALAFTGVGAMAAGWLFALPEVLRASRTCFLWRMEWRYAAPMAEQDRDPRRWPAWASMRGVPDTEDRTVAAEQGDGSARKGGRGPFRVAFPYSFGMVDGELIWSPHGELPAGGSERKPVQRGRSWFDVCR